MFAPPLLADKSRADIRKYAIALMIAPTLWRGAAENCAATGWFQSPRSDVPSAMHCRTHLAYCAVLFGRAALTGEGSP
jgi:hypothetical protein